MSVICKKMVALYSLRMHTYCCAYTVIRAQLAFEHKIETERRF